jgi:hypothetical protein
MEAMRFWLTADLATPRLMLRPLDSTTARLIPATEGASYPFFSPDSKSIAFFAAGSLQRVDLGGGDFGRSGYLSMTLSHLIPALLALPLAMGTSALRLGIRLELRQLLARSRWWLREFLGEQASPLFSFSPGTAGSVV